MDQKSPKKITRLSQKPHSPISDPSSEAQKHDHHHPREDLQIRSGDITKDHNNPSNYNMNHSNGRERLKRHREEVAGRVVVPERWGMEDRLKEWIDHSSFEKMFSPNGIRSAREAFVLEAQRRRQAAAATQRLMRIESG